MGFSHTDQARCHGSPVHLDRTALPSPTIAFAMSLPAPALFPSVLWRSLGYDASRAVRQVLLLLALLIVFLSYVERVLCFWDDLVERELVLDPRHIVMI